MRKALAFLKLRRSFFPVIDEPGGVETKPGIALGATLRFHLATAVPREVLGLGAEWHLLHAIPFKRGGTS